MEELETNEDIIKEAIKDLYITPKILINKWSQTTNQTCQIRMAYPGQHLASLITGVKGIGTAARGDDLSDGSEVKVCSRADQLNECKTCGEKVLAHQTECPYCDSTDIRIKTDSHWIFSIKDESELDLLLNRVPRIILILFDRELEGSEQIRLRAWVLDNKQNYVREFFKDYYENNYRKKISEGNTPAPCNLHPLKYDFYLMYPMLIFHADIDIENEEVQIRFWDLENPRLDRMPSDLLTKKELIEIFDENTSIGKLKKSEIVENYPYIPESERNELGMKKKILKEYKEKYKRR